MNYNDIIVFDFETTSRDSNRTQPVQLAALIIHGRKLEIKQGSEFQSLIKPVFDETECQKLNIDPLEDGAVAIHGKTKELLEGAPSLKAVWSNFTDYVNEHNYKKTQWNAPVPAGYNIRNFDIPIVNRICGSEPYKYGPVDKTGKSSLFHPINMIDAMDQSFLLFENDKTVSSLSADNLIRKKMGYDKGTAHDAMSDVIMTAEYLIKIMKWIRQKTYYTKFDNWMKTTG